MIGWLLALALAAEPAFVRVEGGSDWGCALRDDRAMTCWGSLEADMPTGLFDDVIVHWGAACARQADRWTCWGEFGPKLRAFVGDEPWVALWPYSMDRICGVRADGTAVCTGEGGSPPADRRLTQIAMGGFGGLHACGCGRTARSSAGASARTAPRRPARRRRRGRTRR